MSVARGVAVCSPARGRTVRWCASVLVLALSVAFVPSAAHADETPTDQTPTDSATAMAQAQALRQRLQGLQDRIDSLVREYADAQAALDGAAAAEAWAARRVADLERSHAAADAEAGQAARTLYMSGGAGGLYALALDGWSISQVLDGVAAVNALVHGSTLARRTAQVTSSALERADRRERVRRLTSEERVVLVQRAQQVAAEAQALQLELNQRLVEADATVKRLLEEEEQRRQEEAARQAALAAAAAGGGGPALPFDQLSAVLEQAGFTGESLRIAWAIVMRESGGRPGAVGAVNGNGTRDHGLFQLNDIHIGVSIAQEDLYDPVANAEAAFHMSNGGTNWSSWGIGDTGWAGHLKREIPAVYYALLARFQEWYDRFPG